MSSTGPKGSKLSRPDLASELVQDIIKTKLEEKRRDQPGKTPPQTRRLQRLRFTLVALLPVFLGLMFWNLTTGRKPATVFTPAEVDASVRFKMFLAAQALRSYRDSAGHWPSQLETVGFAAEGLRYERADTSYVLTGMSGDVPFTYRPGDDLAFFRDATQELNR